MGAEALCRLMRKCRHLFLKGKDHVDEDVIILNENFKGLIKRKIKIDSNIKNIQLKDYSHFIGVDDLSIDILSNFNSEKESDSHLNHLPFSAYDDDEDIIFISYSHDDYEIVYKPQYKNKLVKNIESEL